jgi:CheY-like chemotaxis protein
MSKIESGKTELAEEPFDLSDIIEAVLTMSRPQLVAHGHDIKVDISGLTHEKVVGDGLRLQQVFMNILSNAIKYTPKGGRITLVISEKGSGQKRTGHYEAVFQDNGIGMSQDFVDRIFEPFSRADDGRMASVQGTGLGMPIARNIARMMGGDIQVESALGQGTTITVNFFLRLQEEERVDCTAFANLPVLVADDDRMSCESACAILDSLGMESSWVLSGHEAVARVVAHHKAGQSFFAVILDWKMPDMDGLDTARAIRESVGPDLPIIVISAYDWTEIEEEAKEAGVNAFIAKPLFKSRMVQLFTDLVGGDMEDSSSHGPLTGLEAMHLEGRRVLLAEDNDLNAEIATEILEMTGLTVVRATNGAAAVDLITEQPNTFDLVLMDIQMPVMDGHAASRAIRALGRPDTDKLPIIAMTANAFQDDVQAAKAAGMNAHIAKPLDWANLERLLRQWLR